MFLIPLLLTTLLPFIANAQVGDQGDLLRQEFRAALLADPRTQNISGADLDALVESLAEEAETTNAVSDFVLPPLPETGPQFSEEQGVSWDGTISSELLFLAVLASLACAGVLLWFLLHLHRQALIQEKR